MQEEKRRQKTTKKKKAFREYLTLQRMLRTAIVLMLGAMCVFLSVVAYYVTPKNVFAEEPGGTGDAQVNPWEDFTYGETMTAPTPPASEEPEGTDTAESPEYEVILESEEWFEEESGQEETTTAAIGSPAEPHIYDDPGLRVWVGDSRTTGLRLYTNHSDQDAFIDAVGMAYDWFIGTAVPDLKVYLDTGNATKVYINMGVNDCAVYYNNTSRYPVNDYINTINELVMAYPEIEFFFISVGPSSGDYYGNVSISGLNAYVDGFNNAMKQNCLATYIDCAEFLMQDGFTTTDGIHYNRDTYNKIYYYVLNSTCYLIR